MRLPAGGTHRARTASAIAVLSLLIVITPVATQQAGAVDPNHLGVTLSIIAKGLTSPVAVATPNDGSGRVFVVEQAGRVRVFINHVGLRSTPYLDIRSRVASGGERGLLGMAFHPNFKTNGFFYVYYTNTAGNITISRFHATPSANTVAPSSEVILLTIAHPSYANHNGGQLAFWGPYLYIGTGDGGGAGDPSGNAQNLSSLLGKILRIDIDHTCGSLRYCSPSTNPFASSSSARHEIWLWGLRNPWRFSFDKKYGSIWIGDVGQSAREEVDNTPGGRNLGWDCREGTLNTASTYGGSYCSGKAFTGPIWQYSHSSNRCAIVGGFIYRGSQFATAMQGVYLYADYCTGEIFGLAHQSNGTWLNARVRGPSSSITSFGESIGGEIFVVDTSGTLWLIHGYKR